MMQQQRYATMRTVCTAGIAFMAWPRGPACRRHHRCPAPAKPSKIKVETFAQGLDASLGHAVPARRPAAGHRAAGAHAHRRQGRQAVASPSQGVPEVVAGGQGGLLDVLLAPDFATSRHHLSLLRRAARRRQERHQRRRAPSSSCEGDGGAARGREGHLPPGAGRRQRPPLRLAPRLRAGRHAVHHDRRAQLSCATRRRTRPTTSARSSASIADGTIPADNPKRRRLGAGGLVDRPSQRAGRGARPETRQAVDGRARRAGRRRAEPSRGRQELRLAGHHLRHRLLRRQDRRGQREGGHGAAGLLLGPVDRPVGARVLHGRSVPRLEGQRLRRRARRHARRSAWCSTATRSSARRRC